MTLSAAKTFVEKIPQGVLPEERGRILASSPVLQQTHQPAAKRDCQSIGD